MILKRVKSNYELWIMNYELWIIRKDKEKRKRRKIKQLWIKNYELGIMSEEWRVKGEEQLWVMN